MFTKDNFKKGALVRLKSDAYLWINYSKDYRHRTLVNFKPMLESCSKINGMIAELIALELADDESKLPICHVVVWVPQLNGYTFMLSSDIGLL